MPNKFIDCDCEILKFIEYSMGSKLYKCESCKKLHIVKLNSSRGSINENCKYDYKNI